MPVQALGSLQLLAGVADDAAGDDEQLDLLRALEDVEDLGVAGPLLEQLGLGVAGRSGGLELRVLHSNADRESTAFVPAPRIHPVL